MPLVWSRRLIADAHGHATLAAGCASGRHARACWARRGQRGGLDAAKATRRAELAAVWSGLRGEVVAVATVSAGARAEAAVDCAEEVARGRHPVAELAVPAHRRIELQGGDGRVGRVEGAVGDVRGWDAGPDEEGGSDLATASEPRSTWANTDMAFERVLPTRITALACHAREPTPSTAHGRSHRVACRCAARPRAEAAIALARTPPLADAVLP